jgi:hypothetical protein
MNKDNLNHLFENLQSDFDIEIPNTGHENRFLEKLKASNETPVTPTKPKRRLWKPFIGIAATIALILTLTFSINTENEIKDLASVSPEMANTQHFFSAVIEEELSKVKKERTPETELLIADAMSQIEILEEEYQLLKIDLTESGNDKRVIHAMINNFLNRVDLLKTVLQSIEEIKTIKQHIDETSNTI